MAHPLSGPGRLAAAALAIAGAVLAYLGLQGSPAGLDPGPPSFVNADRPGLNAHNSPAAAAHPTRPGVVAVADRIDTPRFSCSVSLSTSAGAAWRPLPLPLPPDAPNCYFPDVAFDGDGDLLVLYTATGGRFNQPVGVWLQRYQGEAAAGPPARVAGPEAFHARLAVDGRRVLVAWVQAPGAADRPLGFAPGTNPVLLARSEDGGRTFSPPVTVSEPGRRVVQPTVVVGGDGQVVIGALDLADDVLDYEAGHQGQGGPPPAGPWRVVVWRSADRGASFGPAVTVSELAAPARVIVNLAPAPSFAIDPARGRLYAAWDGGQGAGRDVLLSRSDDDGATWSPPARVAGGPGGQFLPAVGVAPGGRVDVVYYDRRRDPADVRAEVVLASSRDGGVTFSTAVVSDRPIDTRIGFGSLQGIPLLGSQLALVSEPGLALAFWADTSAGTIDTNIQDLGVAVVEVRDGGGARPVVVGVGVLLVLAGGALLVLRRRPRPPRR